MIKDGVGMPIDSKYSAPANFFFVKGKSDMK